MGEAPSRGINSCGGVGGELQGLVPSGQGQGQDVASAFRENVSSKPTRDATTPLRTTQGFPEGAKLCE